MINENGKIGFYPVCNAKEWDELPVIYKAMDWFPVEVAKLGYDGKFRKEKTFVKEVIFEVVYMEPYKVSAKVSVHRQEFQKIMYCLFEEPDCLLYSVCGVRFENGEEWDAQWYQDTETGAFSLFSNGKCVGRQGGYLGYIPARIEKTETGYEYKQGYDSTTSPVISHYQYTNPFN